MAANSLAAIANIFDESSWCYQPVKATVTTRYIMPLEHERLLTAREAADILRLSESWLAKARMRGDGPPYLKIGRAIRYAEGALVRWMRSNQRHATSER